MRVLRLKDDNSQYDGNSLDLNRQRISLYALCFDEFLARDGSVSKLLRERHSGWESLAGQTRQLNLPNPITVTE